MLHFISLRKYASSLAAAGVSLKPCIRMYSIVILRPVFSMYSRRAFFSSSSGYLFSIGISSARSLWFGA